MHSGKLALSLAVFCLALLIFPGTAAADFTITDVVNAASRIASGLPGYGIAQGSIFVVTGKGVGPDQSQQASFPLPAAAGLGGVSIKASVGGSTVDAIMVYVSANEVAAILPSSTPVGTGTVTVTNGGATATAPITVVQSAFGMFTAAAGQGPALAFNVGSDGTASPNTLAQSAQAGQTIIINGTGLGAISSDETQSGVTDVPSANIQVWVGNKQATVVSAGRGTCCTGLDPNFPIPQGVAAWDVIQLTIPDGTAGCQVSVAVQTGNTVSNVGSIAVAPGGGICVDLSGIDLGSLTTLSGKIKFGFILLTRTASTISTSGVTVSTTIDVGAATFTQVDLGSNSVQVPTQAFSSLFGGSAGSCIVAVVRSAGTSPGSPPTGTGPASTLLDAGPAINIKGPNGTKPMPRQPSGAYSAAFASITQLPSLGPGVPPITTGGTPFLDAGVLGADNGGGGSDIGPFNVSLNNPKPITWDNRDQITAVNRAQGVTIKWSGGDPTSWVGISGTASRTQAGVNLFGYFTCVERVSAGQFTVPPFVTLSLPQVDSTNPANGIGILVVSNSVAKIVSIPGVDLTNYFSTASVSKTVAYQ